jgi:hypothetical protein
MSDVPLLDRLEQIINEIQEKHDDNATYHLYFDARACIDMIRVKLIEIEKEVNKQ